MSRARVPGLPFIVDYFKPREKLFTHFFLSHAHSDHTEGLGAKWDRGKIYCSPVTAGLLPRVTRAKAERIVSLEVGPTHTLAGVRVTLFDANHCPGSVMFLFEYTAAAAAKGDDSAEAPEQEKEQRVLFTGDFRYSREMAQRPALEPLFAAPIDSVFLDTTFCDPKYCFPDQEDIFDQVADRLRGAAANTRTLILIGTYRIGKEKLLIGVARRLGVVVHADEKRLALIRSMGFAPRDLQLFTSSPTAARLRCVSIAALSYQKLQNLAVTEELNRSYPQRQTHDAIIAVLPTGWHARSDGRMAEKEANGVTTLGVAYSEHCSFPELLAFVQRLKPAAIKSIVHTGASERAVVRLIRERTKGSVAAFYARDAAAPAAAGRTEGKRKRDSGLAALMARQEQRVRLRAYSPPGTRQKEEEADYAALRQAPPAAALRQPDGEGGVEFVSAVEATGRAKAAKGLQAGLGSGRGANQVSRISRDFFSPPSRRNPFKKAAFS